MKSGQESTLSSWAATAWLRNGDAANKIGTSGVAIIGQALRRALLLSARPAPPSICPSRPATEIPIEQRKPRRRSRRCGTRSAWLRRASACVNPAFDVTDHNLVTGIITEKGIAYPDETGSFKSAFEKMGIKPVEKFVDKK